MRNLDEMTVKELKETAKEMRISNWWNLKKEVLIRKIEEAQSTTDEEKEKEDAALAFYDKNWRHIDARYNPSEFLEKWKAGKIAIDDIAEDQPGPFEDVGHVNTQGEAENSSMDESEAQDDAPIEEPRLVPMPGIDKLKDLKDEYSRKPKRGALIEFDGKSQNICAWGKELGISANTLYGRIYKMNWSVERAFTTPARKSK